MISPREQAIEAVAGVFPSVDIVLIKAVIREYESARARLDGAKMMPRDATEAAISAFYMTVGEMSASETRDIDLLENGAERIYRAMHDATPKEKD